MPKLYGRYENSPLQYKQRCYEITSCRVELDSLKHCNISLEVVTLAEYSVPRMAG